MSSHPDLPPNPREARYRRAPVHWSMYPVTMVLMLGCIITAVVSEIGSREKLRNIDALFFTGSMSDEELTLKCKEFLANEPGFRRVRFEELPEEAKEELKNRFRNEEYERHTGAGSFTDILKGQVWRLFTPMFIHFGLWHILFNLMMLWDLGRVLEARFRQLRFLMLALGVSIAANAVQAWGWGPSFGGMSGVNYGLFGFVLIRQKFHPAGDIRLNPQVVPLMLIWLVVCFTGYLGAVANGAHVAGLVAGGAIGWINAMMGGGWAVIKRRREFQRSLDRSDSVLHRCSVCKKTEQDDPNMDFRIGDDGEEYCMDHLPGGRRGS